MTATCALLLARIANVNLLSLFLFCDDFKWQVEFHVCALIFLTASLCTESSLLYTHHMPCWSCWFINEFACASTCLAQSISMGASVSVWHQPVVYVQWHYFLITCSFFCPLVGCDCLFVSTTASGCYHCGALLQLAAVCCDWTMLSSSMKQKILCVQFLQSEKKLVDILTRCSSHPQAKSEARCQNMHSYSHTLKDTCDWRLGRGSSSSSPQLLHCNDPTAWHLIMLTV